MAQIDTRGMEAAELSPEQLNQLRETEKKMNEAMQNKGEVYLLAVTRR
ncbi:MAG: hypothetical protein K6T80_01410 [Firmicutes bacterium]|nr:hypothetical protein [Bacillota bacterium]